MTRQHHRHQSHHQASNKIMQHHQTAHQQGLLLERRIIQLLTETNLTFKEIIIKLDGENLSASIGMIRRINRDNRYRRPRYDSKLTPAQRESLVEELRDHKGMKPNLSLLAKRYGVCHGSVWYWWDKLNRVKRCGQLTGRGITAGGKLCVGKTELQLFSASRRGCGRRRLLRRSTNGLDYDQSDGSSGGTMYQQCRRNFNNILLDDRYNYVGRVSIVGREQADSGAIDLPILMFARKELIEIDSVKTLASSRSLDLSPSQVVVVDADYNEDDVTELGDSRDSSDSSRDTLEDQLPPEEHVNLQRVVDLAAAEASLG